MRRFLPTALVFLAVTARPAQASDFSGLMTMFVGVPVLLVADLALGALLACRPSRRQKVWVAVVVVPVLLAGAGLSSDAASLLDDANGLGFGIGYFVLYALAVLLVARLMLRTPEPAPADHAHP